MRLWQFIKEKRWDAWLKPHKIPELIRELDALRKESKALRRWVHARHVPTMRSVPPDPLKVLLGVSKRFILIGLVAATGNASAQPILRTFYTTNTTPVVTAFVSAGGTNSRQFGTLSLTNLAGNPNVATNILGSGSVTVSSNNTGEWTITGAAGTPGLTTNDNQFLGVPLSIKSGAFLTNFNGWLPGTNNGNFRVVGDFVVTAGDTFTENIFPATTDNYSLGSSGLAWNEVFVKSGGLNLVESIGTDSIEFLSPALAASYSLTLPDAQGADGTVITNNGSGLLGWWDATSVIAHKQFGSANLTNWSNIPTGSMANVASTTFLTNWANAISNLTAAVTNSASVTNWINFRQPASENLTNWSLIPTGEMANVGSTTFLTNWANSISNYVTASTNSASVTNWINFRQPASLNLTNWSLIPTGAMANVVSTDFLTNWANAISNLTQTKTALTTNANQFGASVQLTIKDGALLTNTTLHGTTTLIGPQTNASIVNIAGVQTNWGTIYASSNAMVRSGQSVSNAWVGETMVFSTANFTNLNGNVATFSNLANCVIPAHTLTNNGDMIRAFWGGVSATAMQNTQNFRIVYGSTTVLDTGLQIGSNYLFRAFIEITRTGNTGQHIDAKLEWLPNALGLTGLAWASTNEMFEIVETNGINTTLALMASARRVGALTNSQFRVYYDPAVR